MSIYDDGPSDDGMNDRRYQSRADYADDPFKAMMRHYDAKVIEKGGSSICCSPSPGRAPRATWLQQRDRGDG